jgi:uncharacterized protein YjbI with pentapeptide repeats
MSRDLQQGVWRLGLSRWALQRPTELWHTLPLELKAVLLLFGASLLLLLIIAVPQWQAASWEGMAERKDLPKLENDARATLVQALGGAALLIGLFFTWRSIRATERNLLITQETAAKNLAIAQDGQITERYTRAIEQLGSNQLEVRLGAIYALERIARDSERDHWPIMEILTAYIRERAPIRPEQEDASSHNAVPRLAIDIQAILTVLGRRTRIYGRGEIEGLDLRETDLRGAFLDGAHLEGAHLDGAHLEGAHLVGAHLEGAHLVGAHLETAHLTDAHLESANFSDVHLEGAELWNAYLVRASLYGTHLEKAHLDGAHLETAELIGAHLEGAFLYGTHLEGANLTGVHLQRANLMYAHLESANFRYAYLEGAGLRDTHLEKARHLTVEQLATVNTLYQAHLDPSLREQIQQQYPQLLEKQQK